MTIFPTLADAYANLARECCKLARANRDLVLERDQAVRRGDTNHNRALVMRRIAHDRLIQLRVAQARSEAAARELEQAQNDLSRLRDAAKGRGMVSEQENWEDVVVLVCGLYYRAEVAEAQLSALRSFSRPSEESLFGEGISNFHVCGECGAALELVRPGKWQCPKAPHVSEE